MEIHIFNQQTDLPLSESKIHESVKFILQYEKLNPNEINIYFVDEKTICDLHKQYFDDPTPTDCISFPIDSSEDMDGWNILGEVFICPKTAIEYSRSNLTNPYDEVLLYLIHGILHLAGYDDMQDEEIKIMRQREQEHLDRLEKQNIHLRQ